MDKLLSVIIPVFNNENVDKAINSIPITEEIEIIVIDGGSTDNTLAVLQKRRDIIDILISEKDKGFYDAVNKGIRKSSGKWIFVLAADDILICNPLDIIKKYSNENVDLICGGIIEELKDKNVRFNMSSNNLKRLYYECSLKHPSSIFNLNAYKKYGLYNSNFICTGDREFFLRLYKSGANIKVVKNVMVIFAYGGISSINPLKYYMGEDIAISDMYGVNKLYSRLYFLKRCLYLVGHKIKSFLGLKHKMKIYSRKKAIKIANKINGIE